ncbi:MAG: TonB-dependent receptor [Sphingomicrobium sp.]
MFSRHRSIVLLVTAAVLPFAPAAAQTVPAPSSDPAIVAPPVEKSAGKKGVYLPADFARFAPRTAFDMLSQVPGFTIKSPSTGELDRGLGQASENVLINGERIANKSGGAVDELRRTAASSVARIEIVDASSLGVAGLSGQVANIITQARKKGSGQFEWHPDFRAHYAKPRLFEGNVSWTDNTGPIDYTLSVKDDTGRGGLGGPIAIYDRDRNLIERREQIVHNESDLVTFQTKLHYKGAHGSIGNLTLGYTPYWAPQHLVEDRYPVDGDPSRRTDIAKLDGFYYDVNADYEFKLGPGRMKVIGLRHLDHEPLVETQLNRHSDGSPDDGILYTRNSHIGETIGRAEYGWKTGKNDWQVTFERAYNSLNQLGGLSLLNADGQFEPIDFPEGTGKVTEVRYEAIATLSRPLAPNVDLQVAAGGEISWLDRVDDDQKARRFVRPKGSIILGWRPAKSWDVSLKARRRVGQISFYDFLAQPKLNDDRENAGNPDLVPPQSWELEAEVGHELGKLGKTVLNAHYYSVEDIVDIIPLDNHTEGVGNLPHATRWGVESTSTINFDPLGWKGAKLDASFGFEKTRVKDPLTGQLRDIGGVQRGWANLSLRDDVPHSAFAWGIEGNYGDYSKRYYLTEISNSWEGPLFVDVYVEHKNVFGMTVQATVSNILNARHRRLRTVYEDWRDSSPVAFYQEANQLIGPIFSFRVKGTF